MTRRIIVAVASLAAVLSIGAATAAAHGGHGGRGGGIGGGASASALVTQAAKDLSVTRAKLVSAIQDAAATRIDAAVDDGDLPAARAADLKEAVQDNLNAAYALSETKTVAASLGLTTAALNTGFTSARKALATAKIDQAVADGRITSAQATELKTQLASATVGGYKGGPGFGKGFGHGFGR